MSKMRFKVTSVSDKVQLTIGNSTITMSYEAALQLSQWLRVHGKKAKRFAGDTSRHWSAIGILEDLNR